MLLSPIFALLLVSQTANLDNGIKALEANKWEEAEQWFVKAVADDAADYTAHFHLALARTFLNKDQAAMEGFEKTLTLKPGLFEAQINLGLLYHRYRKFPEAVAQLEPAVAQRANDVRALFHLADSQRELKQCAAAEPRFRKALELDATLAAAELGLARCLVQLGRLDEAAPLFEKTGGLLELAQTYEDAGQPDKARPIYEKAPPDLAILTRLAGGYLKQKQFDQAQQVVEKALQLAPEDYDLRLTYGRLLRDKRQFLPAANQFAAAARLKPSDPAPLNELAGMLISLEDYPRALAVLDRLRALNAETPGHLFFRAVVLDKTHQVKPALQAYQAFLAASQGKYPDEEFKAKYRAKVLEREAAKR